MMSAPRDSRGACWPLTYPAISAKTAALVGCSTASAPFSSCWISRPDSGLACLPSRENDVVALHGHRCAEQFSLAACGFTRRAVSTPDGQSGVVTFPVRTRRASLRGCQMCAVLGRFCPGVKVSMIAVRVPRPFLLARPRRPRFGMSDRRPSSLRSYPRNSRLRLSSPGRCASIPRGNQESRGLAALYCVPAPAGCGSIASGP